MTGILDIITALTPFAQWGSFIVISVVGVYNKVSFVKINNKVDNQKTTINQAIKDLKKDNNDAHNNIEVKVDKAESLWQKASTEDSLCHKLDFITNGSIEYTKSDREINAFKYQFKCSIKKLSVNILDTNFKDLSKIRLDAYFDLAGNEIIDGYEHLPPEFIKEIRSDIQKQTKEYHRLLLTLINDSKFNDKLDRFINHTEAYLRDMLMMITEKWWKD